MRPLALLVLLLTACRETPTEPVFGRTGMLSGRVVFLETGAPVAGARVVAHQSPPGMNGGETISDAEGAYALRNLIGGHYSILVYAPDSDAIAYLTSVDLFPGRNALDLHIAATVAW